MNAPRFLSGNEAMANAALAAGCKFFAGYPITPGTELMEVLLATLPARGGVGIQANSEIEAINMVCGASGAGLRSMTVTSGPGFDLMQEGIQHMVALEIPAVIVDLCRVGPGTEIQPYQGDYWVVTRGGGHGGYHLLSYAPATVQEAADCVRKAFEISDRLRQPAIIMGDAIVAQSSEPVTIPAADVPPARDWALGGDGDHPHKLHDGATAGVDATGSYEEGEGLGAETYGSFLDGIFARSAGLEEYLEYEGRHLEDCNVVVVAFGTVGRIARTAVAQARELGLNVGLLRPITLWPFPGEVVESLDRRGATFLVVEMNSGQMVQDIERFVRDRQSVGRLNLLGGTVPTPESIVQALTMRRSEGREVA